MLALTRNPPRVLVRRSRGPRVFNYHCSMRRETRKMLPLVKFCKPEHNLSGICNTIRLGTLTYYRMLDPAFLISDQDEGKDSTFIHSVDTSTASLDAASVISPFFSGPNVNISGIVLKTYFPNCFIWSCSRCNSPSIEEGAKFDQDYTSWYHIPDPCKFAEHVCSLLRRFGVPRGIFH